MERHSHQATVGIVVDRTRPIIGLAKGAYMSKQDRRRFMQMSVGALAMGSTPTAVGPGGSAGMSSAFALLQQSQFGSPNRGKKPLRLGLILGIGKDPDAAMANVQRLGLTTAQVFVDQFESGLSDQLRQALDKHGIEPTALVVGGPGEEVWDFYHGPLTIGLVPRETRAARIARIKQASDLAKQCGIAAVQTHCGFIPENPNDPLYKETVEAIREVTSYCRNNGQNFRYETGQETPITLVRTMLDVGTDNQGVNFDLANLILYGKANPTDAIEIFAPYIQGIHAKDGLWPTNPKDLGSEVPIGKGKVDFPRIIARLKELNYRGAVTIEREISGPQQVADVLEAKKYLETLIGPS
jgi:L-ribulose-5-phosphate 3-epimerase